MSAPEKASGPSRLKLLPHQAAFRDRVFNSSDRRIVLLRSEPGLGKMAAFIAVAGEQIIRSPKSRVLFLVPAALAEQVAERLRSEGVPSSRIDRFRFRELLDSPDKDEIWPRGAVTILTRDFANQTDVQESLSQTHWDLVIADEVHQLGPARAATLRNLISAASKVVLGIATPVEGELEGIVTPEALNVVTWHRDMIVDEHGRSLVFAARPKLHVVSFRTSIAEDQVRDTVNALCETLERAGGRRKLVAHTLRCHLESSPAALERVLRRIIDGRARFDAEVEEATLEEAEVADETGYWRADPTTSEEIRLLVDRALQQIESNHTDAKLAAFAALVERLHGDKRRDRRVCVVTNYIATLYYLAAESEGRRIRYHTFHGGMTLDTRRSALDSFRREGGVLLTTTAALTESVDLIDTSDLVLFDVPSSSLALQQVLGRFDRFGRKVLLTVHALAFSGASEEVTQGLAMLRTLLNA
jgi:superfamily II DNA or RNA helicase